MSLPAEVKEAIRVLQNDKSMAILIKWLEAKRDHSLKTFSAPVTKEQELIHFHMGGRFSALEEILDALKSKGKE